MSDLKYKHIGSPAIKLIEECGELIQAVCKIERFGWMNYHPTKEGGNNLEELWKEFEDVQDAFSVYVKGNLKEFEEESMSRIDEIRAHWLQRKEFPL